VGAKENGLQRANKLPQTYCLTQAPILGTDWLDCLVTAQLTQFGMQRSLPTYLQPHKGQLSSLAEPTSKAIALSSCAWPIFIFSALGKMYLIQVG